LRVFRGQGLSGDGKLFRQIGEWQAQRQTTVLGGGLQIGATFLFITH